MIGDYEGRLARLDETWAAWLAAGDIDALRRRAYASIAFALCSVHTPVAEGEREFAAFMDTGELPEGTMLAEQKSRGLLVAQAWIATTTIETFNVDGWTLAATILDNVYGLGTAKSAFASALCGNPEPYCIDTHGAQLIADRDPFLGQREIVQRIKADKSKGPKAVAAAWRRYRQFGDTTFGSRNHQWEFFALMVPEFRTGGHGVYFNDPFVGVA